MKKEIVDIHFKLLNKRGAFWETMEYLKSLEKQIKLLRGMKKLIQEEIKNEKEIQEKKR